MGGYYASYTSSEPDDPLLDDDGDRKIRKYFDVDEAISLVLQLLLWCSAWGVIDAVVGNMANKSIFVSAQIYLVLTTTGCMMYVIATANKRRVSLLHPGIVEFVSLVVAGVGSWGLVNSIVSIIAAGSKMAEVAVHAVVLGIAAVLAFWHHKFRKPNLILNHLLEE